MRRFVPAVPLAALLLGAAVALLARFPAYAWDDEFEAIAATGKADILTLPMRLTWRHPRSFLNPPRAIALMDPVPGRSVAAAQGAYDAVVSWAAPSPWRKTAQVGMWLERIDCRAGRIGTFLRRHHDSETAPNAGPEAWWPMRLPEAAFFCPGQTVRVPAQSTESVLVSVPDSTLAASFRKWLASRQTPLRAALGSFGYRLEASKQPDQGIDCEDVEYRRVAAAAGQAETVCSFTLISDSSASSTWLRVGIVRIHHGGPWRPLVRHGYLHDPYADPGENQELHLWSQMQLPPGFHVALAKALGDPLEQAAWDKKSIYLEAIDRASVSAWLPWPNN